MKVLWKMAWRHLIHQRRWSLTTGLAIVLAVMLLSGLGTVVSTYYTTTKQAILQLEGPSHLVAYNVDQSTINELNENKAVKKTTTLPVVSYAEITDYTILNSQTPYLKLVHINELDFEVQGFRLVNGSYPNKPNEIAINELILFYTNLDLKVGDTLLLDIGNRMVDNKEVTNRILEEETFEVNRTQEFIISGFVSHSNTAINDLAEAGFISVINSSQIKEDQNTVLIELNLPLLAHGKKVQRLLDNQAVETHYFKTLTLDFGPSILWLLLGAVIVGALIIFSSIFVIRNAFAINQRNLLKQLGILDAIGATTLQKGLLMIFQSLILALICIPLGLFFGYLIMSVLLTLFSQALSTLIFSTQVYVDLSPWLILFIVGSVLLIMILSTIMEMIRMSRLNAIESMKYYDLVVQKRINIEAPSWLKGIERRLAYLNFRRGLASYRSLIASLVISIVLIGMSVIFVNASHVNPFKTRQDIVYIFEPYEIEDGKINEIVAQLKQNSLFEQSGVWRTFTIWFDHIEPLLEVNKDYPVLTVQVVEDEYCKEVFEHEVENFNCDEQGLFINHLKISSLGQDNVQIELEGPYIDASEEEIKLTIGDNELLVNFENEHLKVIGKAIEDEPTIIYSKSFYNQMSSPLINFIKETKDDYRVSEQIMFFVNSPNNLEAFNQFQTILSHHGLENLQHITNLRNTNFLIGQFSNFIGYVSLTMVGLVIIISISNVINSVNYAYNIRLREILVLISQGMTARSIILMILYESIFFGLTAIAIGLPLAMIISYGLAQGVLSIQLSWTYQWLLIGFISILLVLLMMLFSVIINLFSLRKIQLVQISKELV